MSKYRAFSDLFYASYSGLQMMAFAFSKEKKKYSYSCYAFRQTVIKKYKDGAMHVGDMYKERIRQFMDAHDKCWYCGCPITECGALTADHVFPRAKGGEMIADNLIMVCKHCNSSKGKKGLLEWYYERGEFPPMRVLGHFLKLVYQYAIDHGFFDKPIAEVMAMELPFDFRLLPLTYPQPEDASFDMPIKSCQLKMLKVEGDYGLSVES